MNQIISQEERFLEILEDNKKLIFKIAGSYCKDREDRKDLVQEIVLQLYKAFPKYNDAYAITTWLYRIALNISISWYRKEKTRKRTTDGYKLIIDYEDDNKGENDDRLKMLYNLIEQLHSIDKAIIILYLEGKKNNETAEILGISTSNVSTRMARIKKKLSENVNL